MTDDESLFRSPSIESTQPPVDEEARLLRIVWYQRLTMLATLTYVGFAMGPMILAFFGIGVPLRMLSLLYWGFVLIAVFIVFRLAQQVYSTLVAFLCGLLILIPMVGLLILVFVNHKAIRHLHEHGIEPGFLGMSRAEAAKRLRAQIDEPTQ